ncbi:hypothetical protein JD292_09485 [Leucobacter sp. CSA2]|uniref:Uncharacterized protein n=1 Tax=Leucobacter edaphi TaxID=2796472 RepID=A0A934QEW4_9MICO|nr:hypothetical protein [Leucobacter edaphi]MBK0422304.1 hypothetical protein [Leucobacter edaphi]
MTTSSGILSRAVGSPLLRAIWYLWLPVAWFLPVLLILLRFSSGGWETLFLVMLSPVVVPGIALLAALPRFILRRRGWRYAPASVSSLLIASAWGLALMSLAVRGSGDSGTIDSPLRTFFSGLSERAEGMIAGFGSMLAFPCYLAALVVAIVLATRGPSREAAHQSTAQPPKSAGWMRARDLIPIGVFVLVPVLAAVAAGVGTAIMRNGPRDFAGASEANTVALDRAAFEAQRERSWDRLQEQASPVRTGIAREGWLVASHGGVRSVTADEPERYRLAASWEILFDGDPGSVAKRALSVAEAQGWKRDLRDASGPADPLDASSTDTGPAEWDDTDEAGVLLRKGYRLRNDDGYVMVLRAAIPVSPAQDERVPGTPVPKSYLRVEVESGVYWEGNPSFAGDVPTSMDSPEAQRLWSNEPPTFRGDEWPGLLAVDAGWSREWER